MPDPIPKRADLRQRRNKTSTRATIVTTGTLTKPRLTKRDDGEPWHKMARQFWEDLWSSEVIDECIQIDVGGMQILLELVQKFWTFPSKELAAEIRLQRQCYGLTPIDRRRLQWEVHRAENVDDRAKRPANRAKASGDPRDGLHLVEGGKK